MKKPARETLQQIVGRGLTRVLKLRGFEPAGTGFRRERSPVGTTDIVRVPLEDAFGPTGSFQLIVGVTHPAVEALLGNPARKASLDEECTLSRVFGPADIGGSGKSWQIGIAAPADLGDELVRVWEDVADPWLEGVRDVVALHRALDLGRVTMPDMLGPVAVALLAGDKATAQARFDRASRRTFGLRAASALRLAVTHGLSVPAAEEGGSDEFAVSPRSDPSTSSAASAASSVSSTSSLSSGPAGRGPGVAALPAVSAAPPVVAAVSPVVAPAPAVALEPALPASVVVAPAPGVAAAALPVITAAPPVVAAVSPAASAAVPAEGAAVVAQAAARELPAPPQIEWAVVDVTDRFHARADASSDTAPRFGRYLVERVLGRGGRGDVFVAHAEGAVEFERRVAIKHLRRELVSDPQAKAALVRDARRAARLRHPNVVRVYELVEENGELALVMELVDGMSWQDVAHIAWAAGEALPLDIVLRGVAEAALGLHHAHSLKGDDGAPAPLLHGDVGPDTLLLARDGFTKVLDFGLTGVPGLGRVQLLAPERLRTGADVDARADIFSLGITLYWLLTGRRPFQGATPDEILRQVAERPKDPRSLNERIPAAVATTALAMLETLPQDRPASGRAVHDALMKLAGGATSTDAADFAEVVFALPRKAEHSGQLTGPAVAPRA